MIYLDNHATTPCDARVVEAMLPYLAEHFGNPHSKSHGIGRIAADAVEQSRHCVATTLDCPQESVIWTSGATESNNLALRGTVAHPRQKRRHLVTVTSEHHAVLDVIEELGQGDWSSTVVPVHPDGHAKAGAVDLDRLAETITDDTALVSVMWANNEIGSINPMREIADLCHDAGVLLHCDATQAVGRIPVSMREADIDLLSATAHKMYGAKGCGVLIVGNGNRRVRLKPEITGGGQQQGIRSGTVPPANAVGFATTLELAAGEAVESGHRIAALRERLLNHLNTVIDDLQINGAPFEPDIRLPGNLNLRLPDVEGEAWMSATPDVCFSSGSACSSVEPKPSHVLTAIGLDESMARRSVRFGIGKFNTENEIDEAAKLLVESYENVRGQVGQM